MGTPHLSPLRSGRSVLGPVREFTAAKLSIGLPGAGLMRQRKWLRDGHGVATRTVAGSSGDPVLPSGVFMEAPLCPGPGAAALSKTGPRQAPVSPGRTAFIQELQEHLQDDCVRAGGAGLRLWEHRQASQKRWGRRSCREAAARRNRDNMSEQGGWRRLQWAAGSEREGPASHASHGVPGKGPHSVPLASTFPTCKKRPPVCSCAA